MENKEDQMKQKMFEEIRKKFHYTHNDGYAFDDTLLRNKAFHHGIDTVFNELGDMLSSGELNDELAKLNYYFLDKRSKKRHTINIKKK